MSEIIAPKRKKDWPGCTLRLNEDVPSGLIRAGAEVLITRRMHARETFQSAVDISSWDCRVLKVQGRCPACGALHAVYIPESWIAEGKAVFVSLGTPRPWERA